jgi:hypothetical protein
MNLNFQIVGALNKGSLVIDDRHDSGKLIAVSDRLSFFGNPTELQ